jgi:segregation and condensation protein A
MPEKNADELINHLLFHKALISEVDSGERIERYLELVRHLETGMHIAVNDEFERSISLALELVMEQHFDPWDIDLVKFSKMYLKKLRKEKKVDLVTAGKIILMAWSILKLQSDDVLSRADIPEEEQYYFEGWNIEPGDMYEGYDTLDFTQTIIEDETPPIQEKIWHKNTRAVTLMELVDAFNEAKVDVERQKALSEQRRLLREQMKITEDFDEKVHKEDLEEDIYVTWQRICVNESDKMLLEDIIDGSRDDLISRFVAILHLAIESRIRIHQRRFPYGEIVITNITPVADRLQPPTVELVIPEQAAGGEDMVKELIVA